MTRTMRQLLVLFLTMGALQLTTGQTCPNMCSGHGACSSEGTCICETDWVIAADCSEKVRCGVGAWWEGAGAGRHT